MGVRSHVDPCSFVVFMHIRDEQIDANVAELLGALQVSASTSLDPLLERLTLRSHQVLFHESYHFWQGLRLPLLHRYALIAFVRAHQAFAEFVRQGGPAYETWSGILPELTSLQLEARIGRSAQGGLFWGGADAAIPADTLETLTVTPLDLMECAASLAEFQLMQEATDRDRPAALARWRKRNPAYLAPFDFAATFLGDDRLALRLLLPLINAAFHTSEPTRAFVELLAHAWGAYVANERAGAQLREQREPLYWTGVMQSWLDLLAFEAPPDTGGTALLGMTYHRLTLDRWVLGHVELGGDEYLLHPFLGPAARAWRAMERRNPQLGWALDQPGWVDDETLDTMRREFQPPLTVIRFHMPDGADQTYLWGRGIARGFTSMQNPGDDAFRGFMADFLTMYGVVRRASGVHLDEAQRTCHHRDCPHYAPNFCNAYPIVPAHHEACGFPTRINRLVQLETHRHADAQARRR